MRRPISLTKAQRNSLVSWFIALIALYCGFLDVHWWLLSLPLLVVMAFVLVGRKVSTRKSSLRILKSARPLIILVGSIIFLTNGSGVLKYYFGIILGLAVLISYIYIRLIRYELAASSNDMVEHSLALASIFLISSAMAVSLAVWNWPLWLVLSLGWLLHYSMVNFWLYSFVDKPERISLLWSLIVVEISTLSAFWLIFYAIPGLSVAISQLSLIITSLAYCMGGIYYHHKKHTLSRSLIFEYFGVSIVVFGILLVLTRWFRGV